MAYQVESLQGLMVVLFFFPLPVPVGMVSSTTLVLTASTGLRRLTPTPRATPIYCISIRRARTGAASPTASTSNPCALCARTASASFPNVKFGNIFKNRKNMSVTKELIKKRKRFGASRPSPRLAPTSWGYVHPCQISNTIITPSLVTYCVSVYALNFNEDEYWSFKSARKKRNFATEKKWKPPLFDIINAMRTGNKNNIV